MGYRRFGHDVFYSWMGGVFDQYRRKGIATMLADHQETWAKTHGFVKVIFKTRNRMSKMIHFGLNRGFMMVDLIKKEILKIIGLQWKKSSEEVKK